VTERANIDYGRPLSLAEARTTICLAGPLMYFVRLYFLGVPEKA
jgi:hypothetical protein